MAVYAFTSAALNYWPKVRVLFSSLRRHHPEFKLVLALSDRLVADHAVEADLVDEILPLDRLGIEDETAWTFCHSIVELSTAIKPFVLQALLDRPDCEGVFYFDPDMVLFSRVDDLTAGFATHDIQLTPHQTKPETKIRNVLDNEISSLKHGIYNLGFVGVAPRVEGKAFARWWADRIYSFCRDDIPNGLFTDQRWVDLVPAFFDSVKIIRSPRHNVATWNLTTRALAGDEATGFTVDGLPLGFYHFTGFDSGAHRVMAGVNADGNSAVERIIAWYEGQTEARSGDGNSGPPWAYARYSHGQNIPRAHRVIYREREDLRRAFPNPFDAGDGARGYLGWLVTQGIIEYPDLAESDKLVPQKLRGLLQALTPIKDRPAKETP